MALPNEEVKLPYSGEEVRREQGRSLSSEQQKNLNQALSKFSDKVFHYIDDYDQYQLKALLAANPRIDITQLSNREGESVLHYAAFRHKNDILEFLLGMVSRWIRE